MQAVRDLVDKVAPTDATVLISGESGSRQGTGRPGDSCAQRTRLPARFSGINCGALPPTLIESELFGFERGSFHRRGAQSCRHGRARLRRHAVPG
jgi:DNA-binding NtrC family response regulator